MAIKLGNNSVTQILLGSTALVAVYLGDQLVFTNVPGGVASTISAPTFKVYSGSGSKSDIANYGLVQADIPDPPEFWFAFGSDVGEGDFVEFQIDTANTFNTGNLRDEERVLLWDGTVPHTGKLVVNGDSITAWAGSNYAAQFGTNHPTYTIVNRAVGGSGLSDVIGREAAVLSDHPDVYSVMVGTNDNYTDGTSYAATLLNHMDNVRAGGAKVIVWTQPPKYISGNSSQTAAYSAQRVAFDNAIRAALAAGRIDGIVDLAADPTMGPDAAAQDTTLYSDGTHPTDPNGFNKLYALADPVLRKAFNFGGFVLAVPATDVPGDFTIHTGLTPETTYYGQRRIRRDLGDTSIYSGWSPAVQFSTVASGITFTLDSTNHATWDAADQQLINSNTTWKVLNGAAGAHSSIRGLLPITGNGTKRYFEIIVDSMGASDANGGFGLCTDSYGGTAGALQTVGNSEANLNQTVLLWGNVGSGGKASLFVANTYVEDVTPLTATHRYGFAVEGRATDMLLHLYKDGVLIGQAGGYALPFTALKPLISANPSNAGTTQQFSLATLAQATANCPSGFLPCGC